ncbi:MAG: glutamyl-tRNA reductase [Thermoflexibacteraceae bacterium]|jgi:glutamyl-tRNA reductase
MNLNFKALSISYKTAPVEIREKIALDEAGSRRLLAKVKEVLGIAEALIISTCNRTEFYYLSDNDESQQLISLLAVEKCLTDFQHLSDYFLPILVHEEAVQRLFKVCIGLESQVVGDIQIISQAKQAYQWAADEGMAGAFLHRLMHAIFFTNKKVVQETAFKDGAASVSYATVELIEELAGHLKEPNILLIGAGEIGADVARNLKDSALKPRITVINRTYTKAEELAQECGFQVQPYENLWENIAEADIIVSSVLRATPLISAEELKALNSFTFKYLIDLSVPRSIEPQVEDLSGVVLYNVDTITNRANEALQRRLEAIPQVEDIIGQAAEDFQDWSREMLVSPVIHKLKNTLEQIRQEELARFTKQLDAAEMDKFDKMTKSMMQKIIKLPVLQLKAACKRGEAETLVDILNDLFDLEKQKEPVKA